MKYYKLLNNHIVFGAVSSDDFISYSPVVDCFLRASEKTGEYISYQNKLYRTTQMSPIQVLQEYTLIDITEISEEEYNIFMEAIHNNEPIEEDEEQEPIIIDPVIIDDGTLDFIRSSKINEMSRACNKTIETGFDIEEPDGIHHYSYTIADQLNLKDLSAMIAQGVEQLSYHADGEVCRFYTPEEINEIINTGIVWKTYHTTYFNALKTYINSLETIEEISAITYGINIPDEFKTDVLKTLEYQV